MGSVETMDIIKAKLTDEQFKGFLLGNALKYICRFNSKHETDMDKTRDAEKANIYLNTLVSTGLNNGG
jgi:hypothetical protein